MKEIEIRTTAMVYNDPTELPPAEQSLLALAKKALEHAYVPYSKFRVGAAVLLSNGKMVGGSNQENAAYPMCLCGERVALAAAASQYPGIPVRAIAITVKNEGLPIRQPAAPCGACRQVICEHEDRFGESIAVILQGEEGDIYKFQSGRDLLPLSFHQGFLF